MGYGVKNDNLTGLSLLAKDGFTGKDNQTENNLRFKVNGMNLEWIKGN